MRSNWTWMVVGLAAVFAFVPRANDVSYSQPQSMHFAGDVPAPQRALPSGDLDCRHFGSHEEAQAFFEADEGNAHGLDGDGDGIACERMRDR
jgi:hypothetical protein